MQKEGPFKMMQEQLHHPPAAAHRHRILLISDFYPPIIGGMERYVQTLAHELARRGHRVAVATLGHGDALAFEQDQGVRVYRIAGWSRALAPFYESVARQFHPTVPDPGVVAALRRVIARERPDIVHAQGWMLYSFLPLKEWSKAGLVVTLHDYGLVCPKKNYLHDGRPCDGPAFVKCARCAQEQYGTAKSLSLTTGLRVSSHLHTHVDRFLAVSEAVRAASRVGAGRPPRPIEVLPAFIPDDAPAEAARAEVPAYLPPQDSYILFVGALTVHKGLRVLLDAWADLTPRPELLLIGTSHGEPIGDFPPGVRVVHDAPHAEVMAAWMGCAVGVVPSIWPDPCPLVAIEAMACGRPLVVSAVGGLPDLVADGETGLLVPPGDASALRDALGQLLSAPLLRGRMGRAARERARRFTVSTVTERIEQVYAEVAGGRRRVEPQ